MVTFRTDADLEEELRCHLELQAEDYAAPGVSPIEAERRARLRLGNPREIVERIRDQELVTFVDSWYRDFAFGLRTLCQLAGWLETAQPPSTFRN